MVLTPVMDQHVPVAPDKQVRVEERRTARVDLFRYSYADDGPSLFCSSPDGLDLLAVCVDRLVRHSSEQVMILSRGSQRTPEGKCRYVRLREDDEIGLVLCCLVNQGERFVCRRSC